MRTLLLLRGSAGCGKSTWIKKNGLKPYALSADDIRCMYCNPIMDINGNYAINQKNDGKVWKILFELLEERMKRGDFTVIDATNTKSTELNRYKQLGEKYKYRIYCVDFTGVPIETTKMQNALREGYKRVPEEVVDKMYSRFATQKIPSGITVIKPDELDCIWVKPIDLSSYKKIHHIGDIHGCNTVLQEYFKGNGGIKEDEYYIFLGDYIDRGIENVEVMKFLLSIYKKPNILLLEGNHEIWLQKYGIGEISSSKQFELETKSALIEGGITQKEARMFYKRLAQCAYYDYKGYRVLVTHGGLSRIPENLTLISTEQLIKGVGFYSQHHECDEKFASTPLLGVYQIHGHRNVMKDDICVNSKTFNLEGRVEFGGQLRCVILEDKGFRAIEVNNIVFKEISERETREKIFSGEIADLVVSMRSSKFVKEKKFGNISSFNFTKKAFANKEWDALTTKARGLYIDTMKYEIVARGYEKFFNIGERPDTKLEELGRRMAFPVTVSLKENGFLGIISYDEYKDDLFITTKSNPGGNYAAYFKDLFFKKTTEFDREKIKKWLKDNKCSFLFEVVDIERDPHVIEYKDSKLFLLDIVFNALEFKKISLDELNQIYMRFFDGTGIELKKKVLVINDYKEFLDFYEDAIREDYTLHGNHVEGFVIEDSKGFMVKLKTEYYWHWRKLREISKEILRSGNTRRTGGLLTPEDNYFYGFVKEIYESGNQNEIKTDIISLRQDFLKR